ncbi:G-PROTEIN-RECEP-F1-2 domain-containing protein [Aphelenchoides bicaudatus]|nr:G-PROTEIN-RECEP-F1-2 domain-containing protein [Aphelenchoides bicaudatus]
MDEKAMAEAHEKFVAKYEKQPFYDIFPMLSVLLLLSAFGIFGNVNIVWASIRKKNLRSHCNIMIAAAAFSDVFHQMSHFILGYHIFSAHTFIPLVRCFWLQIVSVFWMDFGTFIVLSIGLDRLFSVLFPISYKTMRSKIYLPFMLFVPSAFAVFMTLQNYYSVMKYANVKVICLIVETNYAEAKIQFLNIMACLNFGIIIVYSAIWIVIKLRNGTIDKKIMRSLSVIVCLILFGWFAASAIISFGISKGWSEEQIFNAHMYIGSLVNVAISMQYLVYMFFS